MGYQKGCRVRKLFRLLDNTIMVKLSNKKIRWLVKNVSNGNVSTRDAANIYNITRRRVQQLVKEYNDTGNIPELKANRRPRTYLTDKQKQRIDEAWNEARLGARLLYYELKKRGFVIPKNKIHQYLTETEEA
ncbi:MAG: helix-turn-helix domain-containing protein [Candidatus Nanoarchaeia archaeon]